MATITTINGNAIASQGEIDARTDAHGSAYTSLAKSIQAQTDGLNGSGALIEPLTITGWTGGWCYVNQSNPYDVQIRTTSNQTYQRTGYIDVGDADSYFVTKFGGSTLTLGIGFFDENQTPIIGYTYASDDSSSFRKRYRVPSGAKYVMFSQVAASPISVGVMRKDLSLVDTVEVVKDTDLRKRQVFSIPSNTWTNGFISKYTGYGRTWQNNQYQKTGFLEVGNAVAFYCTSYGDATYSTAIAFYDKDKVFIKSYPATSDTSWTEYKRYDVPAGAVYVRFSEITAHPISVLKVDGDLMEVEAGRDITQDDVMVSQRLLYDMSGLEIGSEAADYVSIDGGVFTFEAPESGNVWTYFYIYPESAVTNGVCECVIDVTSINGTFRLYSITPKTSGGNTYTWLATFDEPGRYSGRMDLNYASVYQEYDGTSVVRFGLANIDNSTGSSTKSMTATEFSCYDVVSDVGDEPRRLSSVLNQFRNELDSLEATGGDTSMETSVRKPDGTKMVLSINSSGQAVWIPAIPDNVLYIGNSLLDGFGTHGMASTDVGDDYYAQINAYITEHAGEPTTAKVDGRSFEGATSDSAVTTWITGSLASHMSSDVQLVIVQLGDNVNTADKLAEFGSSAGTLCSYLRENCPNARVAWVAMWYSSSERLSIVKKACHDYGCVFVDIHDLRIPEHESSIGATYIDGNGDEQTITNAGVASHPSNAGFDAISERIISTLFE